MEHLNSIAGSFLREINRFTKFYMIHVARGFPNLRKIIQCGSKSSSECDHIKEEKEDVVANFIVFDDSTILLTVCANEKSSFNKINNLGNSIDPYPHP